jgi:triacylglycerol esterase/lipase EstA (alpha/beta hydrolase family)
MENGQWVFGVDNLWLLAPTRHGAHNWEGPGTLTPMKALECLSRYTQKAFWIEFKADDKKMVIAGHSMGGHGAWYY